jgi:predicted RNase H-like nuclease (RuvC/YqgF family)
MTPRRYLAIKQGVTIDNRSSENFETMQDEISALRKALREAKAENEKLRQELFSLSSQGFPVKDSPID